MFDDNELNWKHKQNIPVPIGRLVWFRLPNKKAPWCGHYAGLYCDNFEIMHFKHLVNCCESIYSVDEVYLTKEEVHKSDI